MLNYSYIKLCEGVVGVFIRFKSTIMAAFAVWLE